MATAPKADRLPKPLMEIVASFSAASTAPVLFRPFLDLVVGIVVVMNYKVQVTYCSERIVQVLSEDMERTRSDRRFPDPEIPGSPLSPLWVSWRAHYDQGGLYSILARRKDVRSSPQMDHV